MRVSLVFLVCVVCQCVLMDDWFSGANGAFSRCSGPPFLRPLARTYGQHRKCKHFTNLLKGHGYGDISPEAKDLLQRVFKPDPADRYCFKLVCNAYAQQNSFAHVRVERSHFVVATCSHRSYVYVTD